MEGLGFAVNPDLRLLICLACEIALLPDSAQTHCSRAHKGSKIKINVVQFTEAIEKCDVQDELPIIPEGEDILLFSGLRLQKGIQCCECSKIMGTEGSMMQHYKQHRGIPMPKNLEMAHCQQFNNAPGPGRNMFRVVEKTDVASKTPDHDLIKAIRKETDSNINRMTNTDNARGVSPWLLSSEWHLHTEGLSTTNLKRHIETPKKEELPRLAKLTSKYYEENTGLIDLTDELVLQYLNSPNPGKR